MHGGGGGGGGGKIWTSVNGLLTVIRICRCIGAVLSTFPVILNECCLFCNLQF